MKEAFSGSIKALLAHILSKLVKGTTLTVRSEEGKGLVKIKTNYPYVVKQLSMESGDTEIKCLIQKEEDNGRS